MIWFDLLCLTQLSAISWRPALVVEEAGVPGENHRPFDLIWFDHGQATDKLYHLRLAFECTLFVIYKAGANPRHIGYRLVWVVR